jgi:DNA-binding HxlR family transcriptional regulator
MCPIANALDLFGDKWTLVIVRDMLLLGKRTYSDFTFSSEAIPTNILSQRLKRLEQCGFVTKEPYQTKPPRFRYVPTAKTEDLRPVLAAMSRWSNAHIPGTTARRPVSPRTDK